MTNEIWLYIAQFLVGSTLLLMAVWGLERVGIVKNLHMRSWLWKFAIAGSLVLLLPLSNSTLPRLSIKVAPPSEVPIVGDFVDADTIETEKPANNFQTQLNKDFNSTPKLSHPTGSATDFNTKNAV